MPRLLVLLLFISAAQAAKKPITLDVVTQSGRGSDTGGPPVWAPDGQHFAWFKGDQIMVYDVASKAEKILLALEPLKASAVKIRLRSASTGKIAASMRTPCSGLLPAR